MHTKETEGATTMFIQLRKNIPTKKKQRNEKSKLKVSKKFKVPKETKFRIWFRKHIGNKISGIRVKLLVAISIPIILMAVFSFISYKKTSTSITTNYVNITSDTLNAVKEYIFMGIDEVEKKSYNLTNNNNVKNYYNNFADMSSEDSLAAFDLLNNEINNIKSSHSFIYAVHTIGKDGNSDSTVNKLSTNIYDSFLKSEEGKIISASANRFMWIGNHSFLDEQLQNKQTNYAISIVRKMSENNGFIIIDVSKDQITKALSQMNFGEGSIVGLVTGDGYETLVNTDKTKVFVNSSYYKKAVADKKPFNYSYEKYKGNDYLFLYSKVSDTGAVLCAMVPKSTILKQANEIKDLSRIFILIACAITLLIGMILTGSIGKEIAKLVKSISAASKGDLTTSFKTKRKDEFLLLSNSLTEMVGEMRGLIDTVVTFGTKVSTSANAVSDTSSEILGSTKGISNAIDEIGEGIVQQAADTEQCLDQMSDLSNQIKQVYHNTYKIEQIAKDTKVIIGDGIQTVHELNNKSSATTEITRVVIKEIEDLELQSHSIANFIGVINEIAAQTNLLSLNASIEAARAGEAGRGFAVVADEIRKLADQSVEASKQITSIVNQIQAKTKGTASSAKQAEDIVKSQMEALTKTVSAFENINQHVGNLIGNLNYIADGVKGIETAKEETLDAIRNISAISQQTATSSEEVSATANNQISSVEHLSNSASELAEDSNKLEEAIRIFKIN